MSDTPRSDAAIGQYPHGNAVELECRQLERELNDALRWKSEHLAVESWWAKIDAHVRKSPDCALGRSVAEVALEFLEERDRLKAKLKLEKPNPFPDGTDASDLWNMREDAYLAEIAALRQRLTIVKSAAEASVDRAHTQGVMDSILRQEIGRLKDEVAELIKDRERLDKAEAERWQMTYNQRAAGFLIQEQHRVVGHIGRGTTLRAAIDEAMGVK